MPNINLFAKRILGRSQSSAYLLCKLYAQPCNLLLHSAKSVVGIFHKFKSALVAFLMEPFSVSVRHYPVTLSVNDQLRPFVLACGFIDGK